MDANKARFPIRFMASRLGVSSSGLYEWRYRQSHPSARTTEDRRLTETITEIWRQSRGTYGSPRVWAELRLGQDISISRKRVERLMRQAGIEGIYRRRRRHGTTRRDPHAQPSADLVNRQFHPAGPDRLVGGRHNRTRRSGREGVSGCGLRRLVEEGDRLVHRR